MAIHRRLNYSGSGLNSLLWETKEVLKAAGWTVISSGSGTGGIYDTADVFHPVDNPYFNGTQTAIGVGSGLEHFGYNNCWFAMADPAVGGRQLCFVHANGGGYYDPYWWIGLSESDGFLGGSASVAAVATDERTVSAQGTRAAPGVNGEDWTVPIRIHVAADDTASPNGEYGFLALSMYNPNVVGTIIMLDDFRDGPATDPVSFALMHYKSTTTLFNAWCLNINTYCRSKIDEGGAGEAFLPINYALSTVRSAQYYTTLGRQSLYDAIERPLPLPVVEFTLGGFLGFSRWFRQPGVSRGYPNTGDGQTLLYVGNLIIADLLDGATTPLSI